MVGLRNAISAWPCSSSPASKCRASGDRPSGRRRRLSALSPSLVARSEKCRWKPEPSSSFQGLPMNVASRPSRAAISFTIALNMNARSAASSASAWVRLISNCDCGRTRGWPRTRRGPGRRRRAASAAATPRGSATVADRVHVARVVDVAAVAVRRGRVGHAQVELELRAHDRRQPGSANRAMARLAAPPRGSTLVRRAVHPLEVAEAPRDLGLPRQPRTSVVEIGAGDDVLEAVLEARRRRCGCRSTVMIASQYGRPRRIRCAKCRARVLLAARDAVQVGIGEPDGA